jgi:phosphatidylserine decarboxylase
MRLGANRGSRTMSARMSTAISQPAMADRPRRGERDYPMIARAGWPIIGWIALIVLIAGGAGWLSAGPWVGAVVVGLGLVVLLWAVWFFRDPVRRVPADAGVVVSPADGVISFVGPDRPPAELGVEDAQAAGMTRISVFMNIFNVHVNRSPVAGVVRSITYRAGKFFNASLDKASEHNERNALAIRLPDGRTMVVAQIAGLIARRIVCEAAVGQPVQAGERFGLIRFGSRVDVYLPSGVPALVKVGDKAVAGESIFARINPQGGSQP